jgi:hypothetical protein
LKGSMKGIGSELGGVPLGRRQTADCLIDRVYTDQSRLENESAIDHLGDGGRGCAGGTATLGVKGDGLDSPVLNEKGDPREIATRSTTRSAREGAFDRRPQPRFVS